MTFLRTLALPAILLVCVLVVYVSLAPAQSPSVVSNVNLTFTTIDVPGAGVTNVNGINTAGDMVGNTSTAYYTPSSGFLFSGGNFTLFDYPGADTDTGAFGINDSGLISGWGVKGGAAAVGFLYDGSSFTPIRAPGASATFARGINNAGVVVGGEGSFGATTGFALIGHRFNNFSPPGDYIFVIADGINNLNQVVGTADDNGFLTITASSRESVFLGRRGPCHWASMIAASLWACTWRTGVLDAVSRSRTESTFHSAIQGRREPLPVASTAWGKSWDPIPSMG